MEPRVRCMPRYDITCSEYNDDVDDDDDDDDVDDGNNNSNNIQHLTSNIYQLAVQLVHHQNPDV